MAHGGSWQGLMRLSAMELGPFKVTRTNIPRRRFLSVETRVGANSLTRTICNGRFIGRSGHIHSRISYSMQRSHRGGSCHETTCHR
jgi:hypothetical protein